MNYTVIDARHVKDYTIWLRFADGTEGDVDLADELWGPVFEPLRDPEFFNQFEVAEYGTPMHVVNIDHVNIAGTAQLVAACRAFYVDVLGLKEGHRPAFSSRGHWLYAGEDAVVHLTERSDHVAGSTGSLDHFAFGCVGVVEMLERLKVHEIAHSITEVPGSGATQLFIEDPAGIRLELNFPAGGDPARVRLD